jgi:hypothetical protein
MAKKIQEKSSINKPMPTQTMGITDIVRAAKIMKAAKKMAIKKMF